MVDLSRVQKELHECNRNMDVSGINVKPKGDNLTHLIGTIPGPMGTPYEGGIFEIDIDLPGTSRLLMLSLIYFLFYFNYCAEDSDFSTVLWLGFRLFIEIGVPERGF